MSIIVKCNCCSSGIKLYQRVFDKSKSKHFYCNHSCRARVTNKGRVPTEQHRNKTRESLAKSKPRKLHVCTFCNKPFNTKRWGKKTCSHKCFIERCKITGKQGGIKSFRSPFTRRGRSRNEVFFYKKILDYFPNALHNKRMFGEYDADVIIEELKVAIHWNGPIHYRSIFGEQVFINIQKRDQLRYEAITCHGYTNYIIDDSNNRGFSKSKVLEEVDKFLLKIAPVGN